MADKIISINDISNKVFTRQVRGYSIDEVDDFLDALTEQMKALLRESTSTMSENVELKEAYAAANAQKDALTEQNELLNQEVAQLQEKIAALEAELEAATDAAKTQGIAVSAAAPSAAQPVAVAMPEDAAYYRNLETMLRDTLLNAQNIAAATIAEAQQKAETTVADASRQANDMLASAEAEAATVTNNAKVEAEAVRAETEQIRQAMNDYRKRFKALLKEQAEVFKLDSSLFE